jgi:alcohol dehydrogenase class IV
MGHRRPLIVTDRGLSRTGIPQRIAELATSGGAAVHLHDRVAENPSDRDVEAGVEAFAAHAADCVIALGGGSGLDCGKAVALMAGLGGELDRFFWPRTDALHEVTSIPTIAVPTTAGTGAEVEASSMITITRDRVKGALVNPSLMPRLVIADSELTTSLPPYLTAATGMDALSHNLEALCVLSFHPMADAIATEGASLCLEWLPKAVANGSDLQARAMMMAAAMMGATAFGKGLGAMHALSHAIGGIHSTQHGMTNAVLMTHVLRFNRPAIEPKIAMLAGRCGLDATFDAFVARLQRLSEDIGVPPSLRQLGVTAATFDAILDRAERDVCATTNPVPLDRQTLSSILVAATA